MRRAEWIKSATPISGLSDGDSRTHYVRCEDGEGNANPADYIVTYDIADQRRWQNYRTDAVLDVRDFKVALRTLRDLVREGQEVLDLDETIDSTAKNAGDIDLVFGRERANRLRPTDPVDLIDTGNVRRGKH